MIVATITLDGDVTTVNVMDTHTGEVFSENASDDFNEMIEEVRSALQPHHDAACAAKSRWCAEHGSN